MQISAEPADIAECLWNKYIHSFRETYPWFSDDQLHKLCDDAVAATFKEKIHEHGIRLDTLYHRCCEYITKNQPAEVVVPLTMYVQPSKWKDALIPKGDNGYKPFFSKANANIKLELRINRETGEFSFNVPDELVEIVKRDTDFDYH